MLNAYVTEGFVLCSTRTTQQINGDPESIFQISWIVGVKIKAINAYILFLCQDYSS